MIVKKLREKANWSQEQLAMMSGLSIRTIQRVESGRSASLETLKSLASVFETDISTLTEEITMIDKHTEQWKLQPWWFKWGFWKIHSRKLQLRFELCYLISGILLWLISRLVPANDVLHAWVGSSLLVEYSHILGPLLILGAYYTGWTIRHGDKEKLW